MGGLGVEKNEERTGGMAFIKQGNSNPCQIKMKRIGLLSILTFYCGDKKLFESQPTSPPARFLYLPFAFFRGGGNRTGTCLFFLEFFLSLNKHCHFFKELYK